MFKKVTYLCTFLLVSVLLIVIARDSKKENLMKEEVSSVENIAVDFTDVALKYYDYIQVNENYTLSFDIQSVIAKRTLPVNELEQLTTYNQFLECFNEMLLDGSFKAVNEYNEVRYTPNYQEKEVRNVFSSAGRNNFDFKYKKIVFIYIPVGYIMELSNYMAALLASAIAIIKFVSLDSITPKGIKDLLNIPAVAGVVALFEVVIGDLMSIVAVVGTSIIAIVSVIGSPVLSVIVKALVAIISAYLFNKIALPIASSLSVTGSCWSKGVRMTSNLIFSDAKFVCQ